MKKLWIIINELKERKETKNTLYLGLMILINLLAGGLIWLMIGRFLLGGTEWLVCFMGYPAIFVGLFGGILYLYDHKFS